MSRLITKGDDAIFEFPPCENPVFNLEPQGVLWIEGYKIPLFPGGDAIRAMKRYETGLIGYKVVGQFEKGKGLPHRNSILANITVDLKNAVFLTKIK